MTPVVEPFEIRPNNFSRWLFLSLTMLSFVAIIILPPTDSKRWIAVVCFLMLATMVFITSRVKIIVQQSGFEIRRLGKPTFIAWKDITALQLGMAYNTHGAEEELIITAAGENHPLLPKHFQAKPMRRFFEILNEQCPPAEKNIHFIREATGQMNWRNKLKMFKPGSGAV